MMVLMLELLFLVLSRRGTSLLFQKLKVWIWQLKKNAKDIASDSTEAVAAVVTLVK